MTQYDKSKCGIYIITNLANGKIYIGSTNNITRRKTKHYSQLRYNKHINKKLQNAWNKYGEESFTIALIAKCPEDYLIKLEQWFVDSMNPDYNILKIAVNSRRGIPLSKKGKRILSKTHKGKKQSKIQIERKSKSLNKFYSENESKLKGKKFSPERSAKLSGQRLGKPKIKSRKVNYEKLIELYNEGFSDKEVAQKLNSTINYVQSVRSRLKIKPLKWEIPKKRKKYSRKIDKNKAIKLKELLLNIKSKREIAKILGISYSTILRFIQNDLENKV